MVLKSRKNSLVTEEQADNLAELISDRPYGEVNTRDRLTRTSITMPYSMLMELEDIARNNKYKGKSPKNVSAIVRNSITFYLKRIKDDDKNY